MGKKRIAYVFNGFSEKTGYISNCLPKAMANLGHEVHVIAPNVQVYFNSPNYMETYGEFLGDPIVEIGVKSINGFTLHRLPHKLFRTEAEIVGLYSKLKELKPDIVHVFNVDSIVAFKLAIYQPVLGFKYFASNHTLLSVFPLDKKWKDLNLYKKASWKIKHFLPGKFISSRLSLIINPSEEGTLISSKYFGINPKKCELAPLGVDTSVFKPDSELRKRVRNKLKIDEDKIVCVYTGRFSQQKNPLVLAKAIDVLSKDSNKFIGVFIGDGIQKEEISKIKNCVCLDFMPHNKLVEYYNAGDIAVWPREESTSMLDAAACGTPIVVSNLTMMTERYEGNGLTYEENSIEDLVKVLLKLKSSKLRENLGRTGVEKIKNKFSWDSIAKDRVIDYNK